MTCDRSVIFSRYSSFFYQLKRLPQYTRNIFESGLKHHKPNHHLYLQKLYYMLVNCVLFLKTGNMIILNEDMGISASQGQKRGWDLCFKATYNNISVITWRPVLLVEETGEIHRPVRSHWWTLSHNVVSSTSPLSGFQSDIDSGERHWLDR